MLKELQSLFVRDLEKLKTEIAGYKSEEKLWEITGDIKNSPGNLCLHIVGNLNHFIGAVLLETDYVRDRDSEFNDKNVPQTTLIKMVDELIHLVKTRFLEIEPGILNNNFPIQVFGYEMTTAHFLIHLAGHLNYHLGQINYHRRLIDVS